MMQFTTMNSVYRVMFLHDRFHVTKLEAIDPSSTYNAVGQTRVSRSMEIEVGEPARFEGWYTSRVTGIHDSLPLPKEA